MTVRFGLLGAGRIGKVHARAVGSNPQAKLVAVADAFDKAAKEISAAYGAEVRSIEAIEKAADIDAVVICTPTDTHADLIERFAKAGKAIFCEKPIDLSLARVDACLGAVRQAGVPMFVGFNRRFDPTFSALHRRIAAGEIGAVEQVVITSRDPGPPPVSYIRVSGGQFRDMTIHDFDMARWLLGEEPAEIFAYGSCLVHPEIAKAGDTDSVMVVMKTATGKLAHINNSRRAVYGYDQRVEVHGARGRLMGGNLTPTSVELASEAAVSTDKPLHFFLERYAAAYRIELSAFIDAVVNRQPVPVNGDDGRRALVLAEAAGESLRTGRPVVLPR